MVIRNEIKEFAVDEKSCLSVVFVGYIEIENEKIYLPKETRHIAFTPLQLEFAKQHLPENYYKAYEKICTQEVIAAWQQKQAK